MGSDYFPSEVCRRLITVKSIESVEVIVVGAVSLSIGGIRITESSSVGSVSREGVVVAQVLSISLRFGLSFSFPLEDTTVVEVVEVRAVSVSSGVRISSISSGVRISSVSRIAEANILTTNSIITAWNKSICATCDCNKIIKIICLLSYSMNFVKSPYFQKVKYNDLLL